LAIPQPKRKEIVIQFRLFSDEDGAPGDASKLKRSEPRDEETGDESLNNTVEIKFIPRRLQIFGFHE